MSADDFRLRVEGKITAEEYVRRLDRGVLRSSPNGAETGRILSP